MTLEKRNDLYSKMLHYYGSSHQMIVAIEEMAELQKEVTKFIRGDIRFDEICEEIADVEIMIEQLRFILNTKLNEASEVKIKNFKNKKISYIKKHVRELGY